MLTNLIATHKDMLDESELTILTKLAERREALHHFAWPSQDSLAHSAFAKLERIYTAEPTPLFGQESPSLAYNQLTIWRAQEKEDGSYEPGERLMSLKISEQAITRLLFSSNRGSSEIPATTVALDALDLPPFTPSDSAHDAAFETVKAGVHEKLASRMDALINAVEEGGSVKARSKATEAVETVASLVKNAGEMGFYLQRRQDSYSAKRVDLLSEAAHAALHADKIMNSEPQLLLEAPEAFNTENARQSSPMLDALLDSWTEEETNALASLVALEAGRICAEYDLPETLFQEDGEFSWPSNRAVPSYSPAKDAVEAVRGLANSVINPNVIESRNKLTPHALGMSITQVYGWAGFMHSSLPATDDTYFTWKIAGAFEEERFGTSEIRGQHHSVLEFSLTSDDMMMLLRGHPTGKTTPVTLRIVAGLYQNIPTLHPSQKNSSGKIIEKEMLDDPRTKAVLDALDALKAHLDIKGGGKAWKEEAQTLLDTVVNLAMDYDEALDDGFVNGDTLLRETIGNTVKEQLEDMRTALPDHLLKRLLT